MEKIQEIFTDLIDDPKDPMRSELERNGLFELADNIKQNGLINPITVRPVGERYEVVAGHRRLSACRIAGLIKIACVVRELDDKATFRVMAAENLERQDVDPVDESIFVERYMRETNATVDEVAKALRRSVAWVETRLVVGVMPDYMQAALKNGLLKLGVALALVQITDDKVRRLWVDMAIRDGISVAQAEYWLHGWEVNQLPGATPSENPADGFTPSASRPLMFRCAIDGKEYDAATFKTVMIHNANLPIFQEFVKAFNAPIPVSVSEPTATTTTTPQ